MSSSASKLTEAAEALVQAAVAETEASSLALGREVVDSIQNISKDVDALKTATDNKSNMIVQHLADLKTAVASVKTAVDLQSDVIKLQIQAIEAQTKLHRIDMALRDVASLPGLNFDYYKAGDGFCQSINLCKNILRSFYKGCGYFIEGMYISTGRPHETDPKDFQEKLSNHLETLLGKRPKIGVSDGKQAIWYD